MLGRPGYSRGIVSDHFGSRENLLRAVMRDAQTITLPDAGDSAAGWLADTVRAYLKNVTSRRPAARAFMQMWGEAIAADPVLMPLYAEQDARFRSLLADKVREGIRTARCEQMLPRAMAVSLVGLVPGSHCTDLDSTPRGSKRSSTKPSAPCARSDRDPNGLRHGRA